MKYQSLRRAGFLALAMGAAAAAGCGKSAPEPTAETVSAESAVTERYPTGDLTWDVSPEGRVVVMARDNDGLPLQKGLTGTLIVSPGDKGVPPLTVPLVDPGKGVLTAQIPRLTGDLTEVAYELDGPSGAIKGTLHVPRGGTQELVESARVAAAAKQIAPEAQGPNGGIVQVVGDDVVELVADKGTGAVRMYVLDDDLKVIPVGKRKAKIAFVNEASDVVELSAHPSGLYLVGSAGVKINPVKITIVVIDGDEIDVALCHYLPGGVIVVGPAAPVLVVFVVTSWQVVVVTPTPIIVHHKGKGKGKWK
jgi:hypothetical protein